MNIKFVVFCLAFFCGSFSSLLAQEDLNIKDVSGFADSKHHWLDITDHEQVIVPLKDQQDYQPANFLEIANNILLYQQPNGGWPKNYDMLAILTDDQKRALAEHKDANHTTFDNGGTYTQVEYLAKAYALSGNNHYKGAALRGIHFILKAQYDNGGWPQFYPDASGYRKYITFNDGAMVGIMKVLQEIVQGKSYYSFIDGQLKKKINGAYQNGIDCILKCQIKENGKLTAWCQQHDNVTLKPTGARTFELASKCSEESAEIVDFLVHVDKPNQEIIKAVGSAIAWFKEVAIRNTRIKTIAADSVVYQFHASNNDRIVVQDAEAPLIWTRFYELGTNRPMFANRDGKVVYQLSDVSRERRTGYAWYGYWPAKIINQVGLPRIYVDEAQDIKEDLAAENMLLWQRDNGGWPKDTYNILFDDSKTDIDNDINKNKTTAVKVLINYNQEQTPEQKKLALDSKHFTDATIDNSHTVREIRYLLQAFKKTGNPKYSAGAQKGIDYLLKAQYANGGWPQFYPDRKTYRHDITFNDNAMANVMNLMMDISKGIENTEVLDKKYVPLAKSAFDKGVNIILKTQLELNGQKAVWCAQYDEVTLKPAKARAYELPSLSGSESVEIVRVLMRVENPSVAIKQAVAAAINWFEGSKITGYKTQRIRDTTQPRGQDVIVVPDAGSVMWARFYDLETQKPFFCDRDGIKKNTLAEIGNERRAGYAWYGTWPLKLISEEYPAWKKDNP